MTAAETRHDGAPEAADPWPAGSTAGAMLKSAREAAGLSLDQVAQQLKLAPRQVKALEDESFADLPGRTFSRGFIRNYARLLNLDAQELLAHLPDAAHAPALGSPALHSTGAMIAELPSAAAPKTGAGRWLIPFVLAACVVAAAAWEFYRGGMGAPVEMPRAPAGVASPGTAAPAPAQSVTPLANPLAADRAATDPPAANENAVTVAQPGAGQGASDADAPLTLSFDGPSWTEIRDASGQLIVSRLIDAHSVEPVRGVAPFDVVIGNARAVTVTYRGKPVDLAPYTRRNVARLTLK